jgi:hypothetical protein
MENSKPIKYIEELRKDEVEVDYIGVIYITEQDEFIKPHFININELGIDSSWKVINQNKVR